MPAKASTGAAVGLVVLLWACGPKSPELTPTFSRSASGMGSSAVVALLTDPVGGVITGMQVQLLGADGSKRVTKTDALGQARWPEVTPGRYELRVVYLKGEPKYFVPVRVRNLDVRQAETLEIHVQVMPNRAYSWECGPGL